MTRSTGKGAAWEASLLTSGSGGDVFLGTGQGPPTPRQGVRDALGTIHSITGDDSDSEGTQKHFIVANSWQRPLHSKAANQAAL